MAEHPIKGLMQTAMENLKDMVDVNTIIGDPVQTPDGSVIMPISRVGFGFAAGGSEFDAEGQGSNSAELPFGGGAGGGVSINPIGFLVVGQGQVKMISSEQPNQFYDRIIDMAPQVIEKIQQMLNKGGTGSSTGNNNSSSGTGGTSTNKVPPQTQH